MSQAYSKLVTYKNKCT